MASTKGYNSLYRIIQCQNKTSTWIILSKFSNKLYSSNISDLSVIDSNFFLTKQLEIQALNGEPYKPYNRVMSHVWQGRWTFHPQQQPRNNSLDLKPKLLLHLRMTVSRGWFVDFFYLLTLQSHWSSRIEGRCSKQNRHYKNMKSFIAL